MAPQFPAPPPVELGDEGEEPVGSGMDMGRQRGDLVLQLFQGIGVGEGIRGRSSGLRRFGGRSAGLGFGRRVRQERGFGWLGRRSPLPADAVLIFLGHGFTNEEEVRCVGSEADHGGASWAMGDTKPKTHRKITGVFRLSGRPEAG
jgi:hypothetical protein